MCALARYQNPTLHPRSLALIRRSPVLLAVELAIVKYGNRTKLHIEEWEFIDHDEEYHLCVFP